MKRKIKKTVKKKKFFSFLAIILFTVILLLFTMFFPKMWSLNDNSSINNKEEETKNEIEYPLELEISEQERTYFTEFFADYSIGIISKDINLLDGITENEMIDFCRAILSEKYLSSKLIQKTAIDEAIEKYFGVTDLQYEKFGYTSFEGYEEYKAEKVFNLTKLIHLEKDSDIYLVYADCIDKSKIHEETYNKEDIEDVYIFTFKKILTNKQEEKIGAYGFKYVLQKVEKETLQKESQETVE